MLTRIAGSAPAAMPAGGAAAGPGVGDSVVVLRANYRFRGPLADFAEAVRGGDADGAMRALSAGDPALRWVEVDEAADWDDPAVTAALEPVRAAVTAMGAALWAAAAAGDGEDALAALAGFRVLCAHRRGPGGVSSWTQRIEDWLSSSLPGSRPGSTWYLGRPVMVTANDYGLRLFNGDTGVVVGREDGGVTVAFRRGGALVSISPARLASVDTVYATTVHKAQGSEFTEVAVVLPGSTSAVLTRQLLYTAVTRARERLILTGSEQAIRAADRPPHRSGFRSDPAPVGCTGRLISIGGRGCHAPGPPGPAPPRPLCDQQERSGTHGPTGLCLATARLGERRAYQIGSDGLSGRMNPPFQVLFTWRDKDLGMQVMHRDQRQGDGSRRPTALDMWAAGLLLLTVILHVAAMFPRYFGGPGEGSVWSQPDQAALFSVLTAGWALALGSGARRPGPSPTGRGRGSRRGGH